MDLNVSEEVFEGYLKQASRKVKVDEIKKIIQLRMETLRKIYRNRNILSVILGMLCPALALALFIGGFGNFTSNPLADFFVTTVALPVIYAAFAYICYQSRMNEYSQVTAETLYLTWLSAQLPNCDREYENILRTTAQLKKQISKTDTPNRLNQLQKEYEQLTNEYTNKNRQLTEISGEILLFPENKKPKIKLQYLSQVEFDVRKKTGLFDPKENTDWVERKREIFKLLINYFIEVLCPTSAVLEIAQNAYDKIVLENDFLDQLSDEVKNSVTLAASLGLMLLFSKILYSAAYKSEKGERGSDNRELILAYDACKRSYERLQEETAVLRELDQIIRKKEQLFAEAKQIVLFKPSKEEAPDLIGFDENEKVVIEISKPF